MLRRKLVFLRCGPMGLGAKEAIMRRQKGHMGGFLWASHRLIAQSLHSMWWQMPMQTSWGRDRQMPHSSMPSSSNPCNERQHQVLLVQTFCAYSRLWIYTWHMGAGLQLHGRLALQPCSKGVSSGCLIVVCHDSLSLRVLTCTIRTQQWHASTHAFLQPASSL